MVSFLIQMVSFAVIALGYRFFQGYDWAPGPEILLLLPIIVLMTLLAFSVGILVAALTTKYRDLTFLLTFGIQLLMFMSPVIFPLSMVEPGSALRTVIELNPMTAVLEGFRAALLGTPMAWDTLVYSSSLTVVFLVIGLALFQRVQRSFADVI
jgi:lipopolysaccharide transport system permease protein